MKTIYYPLLALLLVMGCGDDSHPVEAPSDVESVRAEPVVGGAVIRWDMQDEEDFLYLKVSYEKYPGRSDTSKTVEIKASRYADSLLVEGLLNKYEYAFEVQPFNETPDDQAAGNVLMTDPVQPLRRGRDTVYYASELTPITGITQDMLSSHTHHEPAGPESNLFDDDIGTIWHSDWASGVLPLPHWIEIRFDEPTTVGAITYVLRQTSDTRGFPTQFGLDMSADGEEWVRRWTSEEDLPYDNPAEEKTLTFDKNYTARYLRIMLLQNAGRTDWLHLAELDLYAMKMEVVDQEEIAEANY